MDEALKDFLFWVVTAGLSGMIGWNLRLESRMQKFGQDLSDIRLDVSGTRLHVAENFASNASVEKLADKLDKALAILNRLEGRSEQQSKE